MKPGSLIALLVGLVVIAATVAWVGATAVVAALLAAGFGGLITVTAFNIATMGICALGWRALLDPALPRTTTLVVWARIVRGSLSELVPISGELAAIRILALHRVRAAAAGASTVVDLTLELASQAGFTALGLALLALDGRADGMVRWGLLGLGVSIIALIGFMIVQRRGVFRWIERLPHRLAEYLPWAKLPELAGLDREVQSIYGRKQAVIACLSWHSLAWIVGVGEAWLALWFLDAPLPFASVLVIESFSYALKSAAFAVPGTLGVQELGYIALGALFGVGGDVALALSLLKRAREVLLAVLALAGWKFIELRAWRRRTEFA